MKFNISLKVLPLLACGMLMASCNDFLKQEPLTDITPTDYYKDATQLQAVANAFYQTVLPYHSGAGYGTFAYDNGTDNQTGSDGDSKYKKGSWKTSNDNSSWSWNNIRDINYQLNIAQSNYENGLIAGNENKIRQYIGELHFFRAYAYFSFYKSFGDLKILDDFSYIFARYEKMGIVGNNGTGKSTFIKILMGEQKPDSGTIDIGETVRFGYYSQDGLRFDEQMKVIDVVQDIAEVIELGNGKRLTASQFLQHFLFTPETQHSYVYKLSGGERRRLYLCTVLMRNPNFLVLDEPTNDLDIITLQVLEEYLQNFKGCVIVVSHDRYFMDKVVDHLLVFKGQGDIRDFPGNYSDYRDWREVKEQREKEAEKPKEEKTARVRLNDKRRMTFKERKEYERLEKEIGELEQEKADIESALCSGTLSVEELTEKSKRLPELNDLIDEKSMRWLELSEIEG